MNDLDSLRYLVLRYFLENSGDATGDLLLLSSIQAYPRKTVKQMVYSLAQAGLLDQWGSRSGTTYATSHLGYIVLATIHRGNENWPNKMPVQP
jgi:hypothetical protein